MSEKNEDIVEFKGVNEDFVIRPLTREMWRDFWIELGGDEELSAFNTVLAKGKDVIYWPHLGRVRPLFIDARRTRVRGKAFWDAAVQPVVFLEGIRGYVSISNVEILNEEIVLTNLPKLSSDIWDKRFNHVW